MCVSGKEHQRLERELLDQRRYRREEKMSLYKLFARRCWPGAELEVTTCAECHLQRRGMS